MIRKRNSMCLLGLMGLTIASTIGCGKDVQKTITNVRKNVQQAAEPNRGSATLNADGEIKLTDFKARLIKGEGTRPTLLQMGTSFDGPAQRKGPGVFMQFPVNATVLTELQGQTLQGIAFVQLKGSPVGRAYPDPGITLKVEKAGLTYVTGEVSGTLLSGNADKQVTLKGSVTGKMEN